MASTRAVILASILLVPGSRGMAQAALPLDALAQADRTASETAARDGFAAALPGLLARRGVLLWPGAPALAGADSARALLAAQRSLDSLRIIWQPLGMELAGDGTLGVTWGVALAIPPGGQARIGRYIAAWQREVDAWKLAAFVALGVVPPGATVLPEGFAQVRHPPIAASGAAAAFVTADLDFAKLAGDSGATVAFERFAAPDAVTFGGTLNRGPAAIGRALQGNQSHWEWHPIYAGAAASGELGWTVGESKIQPVSGAATLGKYLTIWRRLPDGSVRFLTDGGNARP